MTTLSGAPVPVNMPSGTDPRDAMRKNATPSPKDSHANATDPALVTLFDRTPEAARHVRIDCKAKPPGSLGRIEALALQLALIAHPAEPRIDKAVLLMLSEALRA